MEINKILNMINNQEMKEIKGIEDRLFGLDKLLSNARKFVQEQQDLAQSFQQVCFFFLCSRNIKNAYSNYCKLKLRVPLKLVDTSNEMQMFTF